MEIFPWQAAEQFLLVCEAGGLSAAARSGRASISQPALSAQMSKLEASLGTKLFQRRPFALTPCGQMFHDEVLRLQAAMRRLHDTVAAGGGMPLRVAASDVIIRDHLPTLLSHVDAAARARMVLREAASHELPGLVREGEVDLAIGLLSPHVSFGGQPLVEKIGSLSFRWHLPPSHVGLVKSWADLKRLLQGGVRPGLVSLPEGNLITRHVAQSLRRLGIEWPSTLEVSSLSHIPAYVGLDFGFGPGLVIPGMQVGGRVVTVSPKDIPPITLGVWHDDSLGPAAARLLKLIRLHARNRLR